VTTETAGIERALGDATGGARVSTREPDLVSYARDLWPRHHLAVRDGDVAPHKPAAVVWPRTVDEVAKIVERCAELGVPIQPFGAGSGVCGGTLPDARTVVVDLKAMNRVRRIDAAGPVLDVESGALGVRLEEDLGRAGYTLGHFPSSILCSTVGGWVAARSAGQCSGLYGKIEDMVVSLECVVGRGEVVRLRRRVHGPDLTPLIVGSEGVLGIVTSAELRLWAAPAERTFVAASFPSVEAGCDAIRDMFQSGLRPAVCRLYDAFDSWMAKRGAVSGKKPAGGASSASSRALKSSAVRYLLRAPRVLNGVVDLVGDRAFGGATLILVFEGSGQHGAEDASRARNIAGRHGARDLGEAPARHWLAHRYAVSYRQSPVFMSGAFSDTMEVAAPWSRLMPMYHAVREAMGSRVFVMAHFSHAYPDGCSIYFTFAGSAPDRASSELLYDSTWKDALDAAIDAGGTLSHHHGVGRSKAPKLGRELGHGVDVIHALRGVFDPGGIFNPGNLLPRERGARARELEPRPDPRRPRFDDASLLVHADGSTTLGAIEQEARAHGLTLGIAGMDAAEPVAAFLGRGAPGCRDPYEDPVDHLVAGFRARLRSGNELVVRPGPRRAVGPDLYALVHGMNGRAGELLSAHLRVHRVGLDSRPAPCTIDRDPAPTPDETAWIDRAIEAAARA
jgi:alkyldihydroxyacetonephosphate synthase